MDKDQSVKAILTEELLRIRSQDPQYSLRSFARYLNVSPATLTQFLKGKRPASQKFMRTVLKLFPENSIAKTLLEFDQAT